jgi:hypothetical protein
MIVTADLLQLLAAAVDQGIAEADRRELLTKSDANDPGPTSAIQFSCIAIFYSITSSTLIRIGSGTSMPSAAAAFMLMASLYLVGSCTGRSASLAPLRKRST